MANINRIITDFVRFDIENDYYQEDDKDELVRDFKKILYEDDPTIRQWLKSLFNSAQNLADEYDLIADEGEAKEIPVEEPEDATVEEPEDVATEEPEDVDEESEDVAEESVNMRELYINTAANLLY